MPENHAGGLDLPEAQENVKNQKIILRYSNGEQFHKCNLQSLLNSLVLKSGSVPPLFYLLERFLIER
jgi:hypothetical protein